MGELKVCLNTFSSFLNRGRNFYAGSFEIWRQERASLKFGGRNSILTTLSQGGEKKGLKIGFLKSGVAGKPVRRTLIIIIATNLNCSAALPSWRPVSLCCLQRRCSACPSRSCFSVFQRPSRGFREFGSAFGRAFGPALDQAFDQPFDENSDQPLDEPLDQPLEDLGPSDSAMGMTMQITATKCVTQHAPLTTGDHARGGTRAAKARHDSWQSCSWRSSSSGASIPLSLSPSLSP
jgi:hypothetical protein